MARSYTKEEIIRMCEDASKDMRQFYNANFINYRGKAKGSKQYYTEIVAEWLLNDDNIKLLDQIKTIDRENYRIDGHTGEIKEKTNRVEERKAKEIFSLGREKGYDIIGKIIDYQTPLKATQKNEAGKIDLLSKNDKTKRVYILELKRWDSEETMLRCVLESITYLKTVNKANLFKSFGIPDGYALEAAPLVYKGQFQYQEYMDKEHEFLRQLMDKLNCKPVFIEETFVVSK